jgi:hypothetical protein
LVQVTQLLCNRAKMGSQVCLMPKPVALPGCHAASRSPVVLQRDTAPHLPGALSSGVLFHPFFLFGAPKMGQVAPDAKTPPLANFAVFWAASSSRLHPAVSFCHSDGGIVPSGDCHSVPCSLSWSSWQMLAGSRPAEGARPPEGSLCLSQPPPLLEGRLGPWPSVTPCALCHWCVSVPVLWLPVPAAEHDAGLRTDRHLPACDTAEPHRLQG